MKKIVLVEDDRTTRALVTEVIEGMGHCCMAASNGMRALHLIEDNPNVSLLITDVEMPELNGAELIHLLRNRKGTLDLPILIISGVASYQDIASLIEKGATRFLIKPIDLVELAETLNSYLEPAKDPGATLTQA